MVEEKDKTGWIRMAFKGNKVWVAADQNERPVEKNGKALIKYQLNQEQEYWVHIKGLQPVESLPPRPKRQSGKKTSKKNASRSKGKTTESSSESIPDNAICLYTDGASSGNPGPSGIGVVLRFDKHEKTISKYIGSATNNIAELEAIRVGLLELKRTDIPIRIFTDSSYAYGLLALGWQAKKNIELVESIRKLLATFKDVKLIKVKGHAGHEENEQADFLATSAIKNKKNN